MFHNFTLHTIIDIQSIRPQSFTDEISVDIFLGSSFQHLLTAIQRVYGGKTVTTQLKMYGTESGTSLKRPPIKSGRQWEVVSHEGRNKHDLWRLYRQLK